MSTTTPERRQYGNFKQTETAGLGKMDMKSTIIVAALGMAAISAWMLTSSWFLFGGLITATALFYGLAAIPNQDGYTRWDRLLTWTAFHYRKRTHRNTYSTGLNPETPLPGLLAGSRLSEHTDTLGNPMALIHHRNGQVALIIRCNPQGGQLHDEQTTDDMVANWGGFGAYLATSPGVTQYTSTVEVGPSHGAATTRAVTDQMDPDAPEIARLINLDTATMGQTNRTEEAAYVTVTFSGFGKLAKSKKAGEADALIATDIARRLPGLTARLSMAGGGNPRTLTADEITQLTRIAYDPSSARFFDGARAQGNPATVEWGNAGPVHHEAEYDYYRHDSGVSATFKMTNAPKGAITSDCLKSLLAAHPDIHRKRVTVVHHVVPSTKAIDKAEQDHNYAKSRVLGNPGKSKAKHNADLIISDQIRAEVVQGAAIEAFTILVTVTVVDPEKLADAISAVETTLAPLSRIDTRLVYGAQDTAFATALPLGLDLKAHSTSPFDALLNLLIRK